jgi:hypothetical protein
MPVTFEGDLVRDDLMTAGFIPSKFKSPLLITVTQLSGMEYDSLNETCDGGNDTAPDLFVSVMQAEVVNYEEGTDFWETEEGIAAACAIVLGSMCICCCFWRICCSGSDEKESEATIVQRLSQERLSQQRLKQQRSSSLRQVSDDSGAAPMALVNRASGDGPSPGLVNRASANGSQGYIPGCTPTPVQVFSQEDNACAKPMGSVPPGILEPQPDNCALVLGRPVQQ